MAGTQSFSLWASESGATYFEGVTTDLGGGVSATGAPFTPADNIVTKAIAAHSTARHVLFVSEGGEVFSVGAGEEVRGVLRLPHFRAPPPPTHTHASARPARPLCPTTPSLTPSPARRSCNARFGPLPLLAVGALLAMLKGDVVEGMVWMGGTTTWAFAD
jgi:hypothetical protein